MAGTSQTVADNVRRIIRDPDNGRPVVATDTIKQSTDRQVPQVADACTIHPALVASLLTLVAGTATYTLSSGEYDYLADLYLASDRMPLLKVSREEMDRLRVGGSSSGRPQCYSIFPQDDQTVDVTFWPTPASGEVVSGYVTALPDAWGTGATTAPTIPFSQRALRAVELRVAASVVMPLNSEALNALKLDKGAARLWLDEAANLEQRERVLVARLRNTHGQTYRWVSAWRRT